MDGTYQARTRPGLERLDPARDMRSTFVFQDADTSVETCYLKTLDGKEASAMEITRKRAKPPVVVDQQQAAEQAVEGA